MDDTRKLPEIEDWKQCESDKMFWEYLNKVGKRYAERIDRKEMQVSDIPIRMIRDSCAYMGDAKLGEMLYKYEIYKKFTYNGTEEIVRIKIEFLKKFYNPSP